MAWTLPPSRSTAAALGQKAAEPEQHWADGGVKVAMDASNIAENVMRAGARRPRLLGLSIILGALLWTGTIVGIAGSYLSASEPEIIRYCSGRCICDGGSLDTALMQRVCPEGWEKVFARARGKLRRERRRLRRERLRRLQEAVPEPADPSLVPSV